MTDLKVLHQHGLTHHQTGPLRAAGHTTVEAVAEFVDAHRALPEGTVVELPPGLGERRLALVCTAVDSWRAVTT
ncbi:hypothetical protein ACIBCH_20820 [Amycolatopsis thailandensis]|uniref:hypothetical protein n=1 Tax=Amycolatopsis thailandensis TaxID=589330 RepID=UPI0037BC4E1C